MLGVPRDCVAEAWTVSLPGVGLFTITVHWPDALVVEVMQVPAVAVCAAPFESVTVTMTVTPCEGTRPAPSPRSFLTVTVNVCAEVTWLVAFGLIRIWASTQFLVALTLSPGLPSPVARWSVMPPTMTSVEAFTTVTPLTALVRVTVQLPVAPTVVQLDAESVPGPDTLAKLMTVPAGAFTNPLPVLMLAWPVKTCGEPTSLVAVVGLIWMFASTQLLVALSLPPDAVFAAVAVVRGTVWPLTGMSEVAATTVIPGVEEVMVTVQLAGAAPPV